MEKSQLQMKREIMSRVHFIYYGRRIINRTTVKLAAMFVAAFASTFFFSVSHVWTNMMTVSHLSDFYNFSISAFSNTSIIVQMLLVAMSVLTVFVIKDIVQTLREPKTAPLRYNF